MPRVDKIVGPGNRYVAAAKALVAADCGIDFYAGPTEIVIVAAKGPADWIAADLIAQAEHDPDARAVLITPSRTLADTRGRARSKRGCPPTDRRAPRSRRTAASSSRRPCTRRSTSPTRPRPNISWWTTTAMAAQVRRAGSLFVGAWSAQVAGDYAIGSQPRAADGRRGARARRPVGGRLRAADHRAACHQAGPVDASDRASITLARAEGLEAHAASVAVRLDGDNGQAHGQATRRRHADRRAKAPRERGPRGAFDRRTAETDIRGSLTIDGQGRYDVATGIRFFDHMLELFTRHGGFDLTLRGEGDLDVDQHHTVEDVGIVLGEAVLTALGDRKGINRAGYFVMPMDETLAVVAIDLGGRPHAVVDLKVKVRMVGDLQTRAGARFLRRLRHGRAGQRARQGAVRPLEPSPHRGGVQGVRAGAARGLREGRAAGEDAASTKGLL